MSHHAPLRSPSSPTLPSSLSSVPSPSTPSSSSLSSSSAPTPGPGSLASELGAVSRIHPANDPIGRLRPLASSAVASASTGLEDEEQGVWDGVQAQHAQRPDGQETGVGVGGWLGGTLAPGSGHGITIGDGISGMAHSGQAIQGSTAGKPDLGVAAPVTMAIAIILASLIIVGALAGMGRTAYRTWRDQDRNGRRARRIRGALILGLFGADLIIAIASLVPASFSLSFLTTPPDASSSVYSCGATGLILALALWAQYALSLLLALYTLLSLRYPLSSLFRHVQSHPCAFILPLLLVFSLPVILWLGLHGFPEAGAHDGRHRERYESGLCAYASTNDFDIAAEAMLSLSRIVVSLAVAAVYIPVIAFLNRPDIGAAYMGSQDVGSSSGKAPSRKRRSQSRSRSVTPSISIGIGGFWTPKASGATIDFGSSCLSFATLSSSSDSALRSGEQIPPWARLSFPNYDDLARSSKHQSGLVMQHGRSISSSDSSLKVCFSPGRSLGLRASASAKHLSWASTSQVEGKQDGDVSDSDSAGGPKMPFVKGHSRSETLPSESAPRTTTFTPPPSQTSSGQCPPTRTLAPPKSRLSRVRPHTSTGAATSIPFGSGNQSHDPAPRVSFLAMLESDPSQPSSRTVSGRSRASTLVNPFTPRLGPSLSTGKLQLESNSGGNGVRDAPRWSHAMLSPPPAAGTGAQRSRVPSVDSQATAVDSDLDRDRDAEHHAKGSPDANGMGVGDASSLSFPGTRRGSASSEETVGSGSVGTEASTVGAGVVMKTMDSLMRRQTRTFLMWFPISHLFLCLIAAARFAYVSATHAKGTAADVLAVLVILGPGLADVVIFGVVEQLTKNRYRRQAGACPSQPEDGLVGHV